MSIYDINKEQDCVKNSGGVCDIKELRPSSQLHSLLEKIETGFLSEKIFETVSLSSDSLFQRAVSVLRTSYLDSASEHGFQYSQVTLVKNDIFLNEYKSFYQQKQASNYTQEELQETYGFLLFETENQAKLVCQRGLCVGSSAITTLGDPAKGVYISKYSDYLHPRPWYHGKSGYVVIFNLIKGRVKFVSENYTTNYTRPSSGYDCHVAADTNKVSHKTSHFRAFELSQYYLYELSGNTIIERPRQICPYVIVAFQYREPKKMAAPAHKNIVELNKNVISPWKGRLIIQGCVLCDITLWSTYGTVPTQLPQELDFKYVMKVSSLKKQLPEAAFRKQNYLEQKVSCQNLCFDLYEVELSNKQGERIDKLTDYIKNNQLAIIQCLEDQGFFILLTSSALIPEPNFGNEPIGLHGLYLFHSHLSTGVKDLKIEDDISSKVIPVLPALNCALLEAKKSLPEEGTRPNTLVKHTFQELYKADKSRSLTVVQDEMKRSTFFGKSSSGFDLVPPPEKCPVELLTQLRSYFSDPSGYTLEVCTALDLPAEHPQSPCSSDGICDAGFSLVMTPDPELLDSEVEARKETETEKNSEEMLRAKQGVVDPPSPASNPRVQPKRRASVPLVLQSQRGSPSRPLPERTAPGTGDGSHAPTTPNLVKGQFPQRRKRGAEVLTAQFIQKTKLDRKNEEASISKDVPVATNAKRAKKQEKFPVKTVARAKPPLKKSPQKQRVNVVKGNQNPRIRKQPQPAKGETDLPLQSKISSNGQKDGISINKDEPESTIEAHKDLPENSIINYDSQALNMLADLALSSATSCTSSCEPRILPCSSELPQSDSLLSEENSLCGTSDHEYHRGIKSQKGEPLPKPPSDRTSNSGSGLTISQEEEHLVSCSQAPGKVQSAPSEETVKSSDVNQNCLVAVEHSYALLLAEHSKKHTQQRGLPGPGFARNGTKGPEAGTPVGKVMPFRHLQNTSPLQKVSEDPLIKRKNRFVSSHLKDFYCSHSVLSCGGSFKITFKCETEYAFSLDSKYTNNPLEKTVIRALHGPWNTNLPDNVEEVKLLLHMWVALFYSNQNKVIRSSRKVVEHSNPAKYVSINSTLESFELSEIEESSSVERYSAEPVLETNEASRGHATEVSFPGPNCLLPLIKPPPIRGLELCVENEQKETLARVCHSDTSESQNFIYLCNNEVIGKAKQESSDKLETSNLVLSSIGSMQTNGPSILGEEKTFQSLDTTRVASYNETAAQATFTTNYDGAVSQSVVCQKSVYSTLENKADIIHAAMQTKTGVLQELTQHSSPINDEGQPSLERTDDNMGYVMINLEPVTLTSEKNAYIPMHSEVTDKPTAFDTELIKQVSSSAVSPTHTVSILEEAQTQDLAVSGQKATNHLSASVRKAFPQEPCSLQKEKPPLVPSLPSDKALIMEALSLVKSSSCPLPSEEMKGSQDCSLQTQSVFSISSEEIIEPSQVEVVSSSASASFREGYSLNCIPPRITTSDGSLEIRKNDKSNLNHENMNVESFTSVFAQQTTPSMSREEASLELSEEDSDIDLTLTISPPTSPTEKMPGGKIQQLQEAPVSNLELQDTAEEVVEPEEVTLMENREVNSASYMSVCPEVSEKPLENKDRKSDNLQPVTLILSKENCTLEIAEEINVTSDFPFDSLIEEVSPPSSPDPPLPVEKTIPSQAVSPCSVELNDTQYEKSNKSQVGSRDLAVTEKEDSFVSLNHPVGQGDLTQVQQVQLSAEMPLKLTSNPGRKGRPNLPGRATEDIIPGEHDEGFSFSEKVQCYDTVLNTPALAARYSGNFNRSLEKLVTSANPLQPISIENRNSDSKHLVLESSEPPFSPQKIVENKSLADRLVSTTALSGILNMSLKQQTSPKSVTKNLCDSDLKTDADGYMQVKSMNSASIDGTGVTQTCMQPEIPNLGSSSDSTASTPCTQPGSVEPGFQTQEISVVRMANLLKNSETKAELHEESTDLVTVSLQSNSTSSTKGEHKIHMLQDTSTCEMKELLNGGFFPTYAGSYQNTTGTNEIISKETSDSTDSLVCGTSKENINNKSKREGYRAEAVSETLSRDRQTRVDSDMHYEPLSGDSDRDSLDYRNSKLDVEDLCTLRSSHTSTKEDGAKESCGSFMNANNSDDEAWVYNRVPGLETTIPPRNRAIGLKQEDKCVPCYVQIRDRHGIPRTYANFTITKEFKDTTRTLHSLKRQPSFTANCGLLSSWTSTWQVADDLTQNTLDLEYLRFAHKIKQIVKKGDSQKSTSSPSVFPKESPTQIMVGTLPLTKVSEAPIVHPASKSRSPILVTIVHSDARQHGQRRRGHTPSHTDSTSSFWKERCSHSRNLTNSRKNQTVSFHLNKLKYNSTLKESRNDISLILNEYAEFNKVMMNSNQVVLQDKELNVASEARSQEIYPSFPRQTASYEDMITDLCANLHVKLKSVMKEACKSPFLFHLVETEEKSFFLRTKNILRKGGHTEIEPQHFCQAFHRESDKLIVIIRNEDLSSHLHQIPSLLKLKHFPSVIFAGIDSPEDVLNDTYQELFRTGGFVISDDKILEHLTLAQLKEIVKILEKLNGNGRWKWLLHYRESKKLKEDIRVDSIAHKKNLILKSYQSANIIELLHYHQCDSRSPTKAEILKCLINLQIQHVDARFAVFLTDKPTVSREVFENSGILVTDVNNFIENIQKIAAPFRSSYW